MNKYVLLTILLPLMCKPAFAKTGDLPKRPYQQTIEFSPIGYETSIKLSGEISIPKPQIAKNDGPSGVTLYRKKAENEWEKLNKYSYTISKDRRSISFVQDINLSDKSSDLAVHVTVTHCHETGRGLCVIDHFQGIVRRQVGETSRKIHFDLKATDPKTFR